MAEEVSPERHGHVLHRRRLCRTEDGNDCLLLYRPGTCEAVLAMRRGASFVARTCGQDVSEGIQRNYGDTEPSAVSSTSIP